MFRIGHGYDVHKLVKGRKLILGGVEIPHETGLLGHSDADVLVHAIMDAILGAAGLDDIGTFFPDTDERFKDINSLTLLKNVIDMIRERRYEIGNIDSTIIAERPKLRGYIDTMKDNIAKICGIEAESINIKATTEEGLGFTGNKEGIAAHAVVLIVKQGI
jgi:2-C-methyl-D-erythritol 2,4-cyclodiphosphate synthase